MHFDEQLLASLSEADLEDQLNWTRTREKEYRRRGNFGLAYFWGGLSLDVIDELGRRYLALREAEHEQLALEVPPRVEPELRLWRAGRSYGA